MRRSVLVLGLVVSFCSSIVAQQPPGNFDEAKAGTYTLPDPLVFNDGQPVKTAKEWSGKRRSEIVELFTANVYGRTPKKPHGLHYEVFEEGKTAFGGKAIRKQIAIDLTTGKDRHKEDLLLYLPSGSTKPVPVILAINFSGNQSVTDDPGVKLPVVWSMKTHERQQATNDMRNRDKSFDIQKILEHGYGFATICYQDIEPDFKGGITYGIRPAFFKAGQTQPAPEDWGAIGAWSYGLSRALDYLEKDKSVDAKRVAVMGHSRLGKTVLWAGAIDQRFAMVLASCPGEGGASLFRRNYGETIRNLVNSFPYWFAPSFAKFADKAGELPLDAHELIALAAPRPIYITGAEDDQWADPKGEFLACVAAGPVYRLLGVPDLGTNQMPQLNQPIMHTIGFHYRSGKHAVTAFDWDQFLAFADLHLRH